MRILYWTEQFWPSTGGMETLTASLVKALQERGSELAVVTSRDRPDLPEEDQYGGIPVHRFPFYAALATRDVGSLARIRYRVAALRRAFAPDLVHLHTVGPSALFHLQTSMIHAAPVLVTPHAPLTSQSAGRETLLGATLRSADWVTADSAAALAVVRGLAPEVVRRSSLVYNGVEAPTLSPTPLPRDPPRVLCLGRLVPEKGFDLALTAFASLAGRFPAARLVVAGEGPARPALERHAAALGLGVRIEFAGRVHEVPPVLNTATLVTVPSRWDEPFGLVAVEAALMARPVVATRAGGLPEVVLDGQTGLIVPKDDAAALAEAMAFLLGNLRIAEALGQAARSRARDLFSLTRCADTYVALYQTLARRPERVRHP